MSKNTNRITSLFDDEEIVLEEESNSNKVESDSQTANVSGKSNATKTNLSEVAFYSPQKSRVKLSNKVHAVDGKIEREDKTILNRPSHLMLKLMHNLFQPNKPDKYFLNSIAIEENTCKNKEEEIERNVKIENYLTEEQLRIYKKANGKSSKELMQALFMLHSEKVEEKSMLEIFEENLKSMALGMVFDESSVRNGMFETFLIQDTTYNLKSLEKRMQEHNHNLLRDVLKKGFMYKKMKLEYINSDRSKTMDEFLQDSKHILVEYENAVLQAKQEYMHFVVQTYKTSTVLTNAYDVFMHIKEKKFILNDKQTNSEFCLHVNNLFDGRVKYHARAVSKMVIEFLTNGVVDNSNEFFIKQNKNDFVVDYGLVPTFVSNEMAETILYIGKYTAQLKKESPTFQNNDLSGFDILDTNVQIVIFDQLKYINNSMKPFITNNLQHLFNFINNLFLFKRCDFIDVLFREFKENRNLNKKSILSIIEESMIQTNLTDDPLASLDIKADAANIQFKSNSFNLAEEIFLEEPFALYCKLNPALSSMFDLPMLSHKLMVIFKFLWKLKKVENLIIRIEQEVKSNAALIADKTILHKIHTINVFVSLLSQYVYYDVILVNTLQISFDANTLVLSEIKKDIEKRLDTITKKLFLQSDRRLIEQLLCNIEVFCLGIGHEAVKTKRNSPNIEREFSEVFNKAYLSIKEAYSEFQTNCVDLEMLQQIFV